MCSSIIFSASSNASWEPRLSVPGLLHSLRPVWVLGGLTWVLHSHSLNSIATSSYSMLASIRTSWGRHLHKSQQLSSQMQLRYRERWPHFGFLMDSSENHNLGWGSQSSTCDASLVTISSTSECKYSLELHPFAPSRQAIYLTVCMCMRVSHTHIHTCSCGIIWLHVHTHTVSAKARNSC